MTKVIVTLFICAASKKGRYTHEKRAETIGVSRNYWSAKAQGASGALQSPTTSAQPADSTGSDSVAAMDPTTPGSYVEYDNSPGLATLLSSPSVQSPQSSARCKFRQQEECTRMVD